MRQPRYKILTALMSLLTIVSLLAGTAFAATVTVSAPTVEAQAGNTVEVPLTLSGANGLGAVHLEVTYDPKVLNAEAVTKGDLAGSNALLESNLKQPGQVVIGIVSLDSIKGDGTLATIRFKAVGDAGLASDVTLSNNQAWERESHAEVLVNSQAGKVTLAAGLPSWLIPVAIAVGVGLLLLLLFWLFFGRRRKQPQPAYAAAGAAAAGAAYNAPTSPPPANMAPPKAKTGATVPPMELPEARTSGKATTNAAPFKQSEEEYFKLKGQVSTGRITRDEFENKLRDLVVQDGQGRYWMLGADTGKWYLHDGQSWNEAQPY